MEKKQLIKTEILTPDTENLIKCADLIKCGCVVAFPTETVYGLGASALDERAVKKIYEAKGRPSDNPLIVHISDKSMLNLLATEIPEKALRLMDVFMPGALTLIFKKTGAVPDTVTGGLKTVAVRMPKHEVALKFISECGVPIAAPSANKSGRPSPTRAQHVFDDMNGRIEFILDGGDCEIGLESTVLDITKEPPVLLRSGGVSVEQIESVIGKINIYKPKENEVPLSPGMKYKHYAPECDVYLAQFNDGMRDRIMRTYDKLQCENKRVAIICLKENKRIYGDRDTLIAGENLTDYAHNLFNLLRTADRLKYDAVIAEGMSENGIGATIINRLTKSSGGRII